MHPGFGEADIGTENTDRAGHGAFTIEEGGRHRVGTLDQFVVAQGITALADKPQIGRASCRERV